MNLYHLYQLFGIPLLLGIGCAYSLWAYFKHGKILRLIAVGLTIFLFACRNLHAYPTEDSREAAAVIMTDAAQNAVEAVVNVVEAVVHAGEPAIAAVDVIQAGVNLSNAVDKAREAGEVFRNKAEDIMSSQGLLEHAMECQMGGTLEATYGKSGND